MVHFTFRAENVYSLNRPSVTTSGISEWSHSWHLVGASFDPPKVLYPRWCHKVHSLVTFPAWADSFLSSNNNQFWTLSCSSLLMFTWLRESRRGFLKFLCSLLLCERFKTPSYQYVPLTTKKQRDKQKKMDMVENKGIIQTTKFEKIPCRHVWLSHRSKFLKGRNTLLVL